MLSSNLKELLATQFSYFIKAQFFHWNVEGSDFGQLHDFFGKIYSDAYDAVDPLAEYIRTLGEYTPGSLSRFAELTQIPDQSRIPSASLMLQELNKDNDTMIALLKDAFDSAVSERQEGIANFLSERLDVHGKWSWQIKAFLKS
jgi:starvation-inducible DNA-binding protein